MDQDITQRCFHNFMVHLLKIMLQILDARYIIQCVQLRLTTDIIQLKNYDRSSSGVRLLLTQGVLLSIDITINFIVSWLQSFNKNYLHITRMYCEQMSALSKKIPITIPACKTDYHKKKGYILLTCIGGNGTPTR